MIAVYMRLSAEDADDEESSSIKNQRLLIRKFIRESPELNKCQWQEYCDDGFSGINFQRPGIQKLFQDMKSRNFDCVIVKDFSRFSRDYIDMGTCLGQIFPFLGIRFIAIMDNYDSARDYTNPNQPHQAFKILLNNFYCVDISNKTKASLKLKRENREFTSGLPPLGYERIPGSHNQIRINEKEAKIVRHIFRLSASGLSPVEIEKRLFEEKVPTYSILRNIKLPKDKRIKTWNSGVIRTMLDNRFYLGELVYNKTEPGYSGNKKPKALPKSQWISIPDSHQAIISRELFEKAGYHKKGPGTKAGNSPHPLAGKLYCGGCGYSMSYKRPSENNKYPRYECRKHSQLQIPLCCTCLHADVLEKLVLTELYKEILKSGCENELRGNLNSYFYNKRKTLNEKAKKIKKQIKTFENMVPKLYEVYMNEKQSREDYIENVTQLKNKILRQKELLEEYEAKLSDIQSFYGETKTWEEIIRYFGINGLTREAANTFIQKIRVYKGNRIEIQWNFSFHPYH